MPMPMFDTRPSFLTCWADLPNGVWVVFSRQWASCEPAQQRVGGILFPAMGRLQTCPTACGWCFCSRRWASCKLAQRRVGGVFPAMGKLQTCPTAHRRHCVPGGGQVANWPNSAQTALRSRRWASCKPAQQRTDGIFAPGGGPKFMLALAYSTPNGTVCQLPADLREYRIRKGREPISDSLPSLSQGGERSICILRQNSLHSVRTITFPR